MASLCCAGFRFAALACGIKSSGLPDLGIIACDGAATAAAVFTKNRLAAAPVRVSRAALARTAGVVRAVVVNSGNANACTGASGLRDARTMARQTAALIDSTADEVIVASTGVIGVPLPIDAVAAGIEQACKQLHGDGFSGFAEAILTTDRAAKTAQRSLTINGETITIIGCTKGAGMIAPNMATTLTFVTTDARVSSAALQQTLGSACATTFNAITVDGDTSTNDMIVVLASGVGNRRALRGKALTAFATALTELLDELAQALMSQGEGVHHVVTIRVRGAASDRAAQTIARRIANSPLVKTAIAGADPNWGRILCAAGNAGVAVRPASIDLFIGEVQVVAGGARVAADIEASAAKVMTAPRYPIIIDLNMGPGSGQYLACDLSHDYVTINADYRS